MGKRQPTERSALLGDSDSQRAAVSLHDAAEASPSPHHEERERGPARTLARHFRRGMRRYKREIVLAAVAAAVVAVVLAFAFFRSEVAAPTPAVVGKIDEEEFDAIVIGGGPAGSVISKLLSDDPWRKVLLIEAGDTSQVELGGKAAVASALNVQGLTPFDVPFYWTNVANTARLHWDYPGVNVAKALGGCGIHNAMLYGTEAIIVRALPRDMDRWAMANWTWAKALEIYLQMEDYDGPNSSYHGTQGFVRTSGPGVRDQLSEEFVQACEQVGIPRTADFNAPGGRFGTGYYHFNTRNGVRESAARTFLGPFLQGHEQSQQSNFRILLNTMVSKIVISDASEAQGVEIIRSDGTLQIIWLSKRGQVIVTAGAINTPKVLLMSGVGDEAALQRLNITVKKHLPRVGMNLQDHPVLGVTFDSLDPLAFDLQSELEHYFKAKHANATNASSYGVMGSAGISAGAFLIPPGSTIPEIQLTFFPRKSEPHISNSSDLNHTAEILFTVALLTPRARNRVVLVPRSNESSAELIPRVVSEVPEAEAEEHLRGDDVWKLSWGVSVVREIASVLAKRGLAGREISPGAEIREPGDLNAWVLGAVFRNSHWVGSASMADSEEEGVVDNHLRVFGVKNLRVADASVIPAIPNGNVHSSVLMVASHAAELIRADDQPVGK